MAEIRVDLPWLDQTSRQVDNFRSYVTQARLSVSSGDAYGHPDLANALGQFREHWAANTEILLKNLDAFKAYLELARTSFEKTDTTVAGNP